MCPVRLSVVGRQPTRVPVVEDPFWIGRDPGCDLCLWDLRVSRQHAKLVKAHGEYLLSSEGRNGVFLNGNRVPVISLRHGDCIQLTPPDQPDPVTLRFENDLEGSFVAPGASLTAAWFEKEKARPEALGLGPRYQVLGPLTGTWGGPSRAQSLETGLEVVLKELSPVIVGHPSDAWLRFVTAVAGASHPSLGRVVDGGVRPSGGLAVRWMALEPVPGRAASLRIAEGAQPLRTVVGRVRSLAAALHLLHSRGVVHGGVVPENVILRPDGGASLVGYGRAFLRRDGRLGPVPASTEVDYLAPEVLQVGTLPGPAADVFGLVAVAVGMATGHPPFERSPDGDRGPRRALSGTTEAVPPELADLLSRALADDPAERPTAEDVGLSLAYVEAVLRPSS